MKTILSVMTGVALMAVATVASAGVIVDAYWGSNDHGYEDIISSSSDRDVFDIDRAEVGLSGADLIVRIITGFAGNTGGFEGYTRERSGLGYGDLFLSSDWTPHGSGPHYQEDNASNGNHWTYGFVLDNHFGDIGNSGNGTLYALNSGNGSTNNPDARLAEYFMTGATYRNGQAVAVNTAGLVVAGSGSWQVDNNVLQITLKGIRNLSAGPGLDLNNLGLHWAMYCANDVIEGVTSVPEPGSLSLTVLAFGLLGLAYARRRRYAPAQIR